MSTHDDDFLQMGRKGQLAASISYLMLKGAGWALAAVFLIGLGVAVIAAVGRVLPEQSRQTPDPAPQAYIDMTAPPVIEEEVEPGDAAVTTADPTMEASDAADEAAEEPAADGN